MPNIDRRDDEMPTQSLLMRFQSPYPRISAYAKPDNFEPSALKRELVGNQDRLSEHLKEKIKAAAPLNRFCGGKSKPYKRK